MLGVDRAVSFRGAALSIWFCIYLVFESGMKQQGGIAEFVL